MWLLFLLIVGLGCGQRPVAIVSNANAVQDHLGRSVSITPQKANRIVSLTPALTETLFALGYGDRIVGVTEYSTYPPEAKEKKSVGGPDEKRLSFETIVSLKPDIVFADSGFQKGAVETLEKLGVTVFACEAKFIPDVPKLMRQLEELLGQTEASKRVIDQFIENEKIFSTKRYPNPPSVFYFVGDPLFTAGGPSFTNELIERAGGRNLFGDLDKNYLSVSEEELVKRNPDIIVLVRDFETKRAELLAKPTWRTLNAIKNKRIVFLDEDSASRPGPRIFDAIRDLELALHPKPTP